jgi:hypothetical protein
MYRREALISLSAWILALAEDLKPLRIAAVNFEEPCFLGDDYCPDGAPLPDKVCVRTRSIEHDDLGGHGSI